MELLRIRAKELLAPGDVGPADFLKMLHDARKLQTAPRIETALMRESMGVII